jgi:hypothetical protein
MRVRCRAIADYRSNAVGSLELEGQPGGLAIALRGVSSYREGYAPGPPVYASAVIVPWPDVYATRIGEDGLLLSVNARRLPQNRLLLEEFADPPPEDPSGLSPGRRLLIVAAMVAALLALGVPLGLQRALPQPQALGTFGMAALLATLVMAVVFVRSRRAPQRSSSEVLSDFSLELARYLPNHIAVEAPMPAPRRFEPIALSSYLPRSAVGIAITLAAATLAALVGSSAARPAASSGSAAAQLPPGVLPSGSAPPARSVVENTQPLEPAQVEPSGAGEPPGEGGLQRLGEPCGCERDETLLWRDPLPRLAPVIIEREVRLHDGHRHTELELALVNDGAEPAERISLSVAFFEERVGAQAGAWQTGERPLSFEGPLGPGSMMKWHVEGRGTSFDIVGDFGALAPDGSDAAPAEVFDALAREGARAVRLHAARLLAFLGDPRAADAALALRPSASSGELAQLDRIAAAPRDVVTCRIRVTRERSNRWRLDACLFNRAPEPRERFALRLLALDDTLDTREPGGGRAPRILAEHTTRFDVTLAPNSGRGLALWAPLPLEPGVLPRAFEVMVDREENLP